MSMINSEDTGLNFLRLLGSSFPGYHDLLRATSDKEFDDTFDGMLVNVICDIEKDAKNLGSLNENGLTSVISIAMNQIFGVKAKREENSNGHVDLTIDVEFPRQRRRLGEAKIYSGYSYHKSGVNQLLNRYTTGREGRGMLIVYVKESNIKEKIDNLLEAMNQEKPCGQIGEACALPFRWSFLSNHLHHSGETMDLGHYGCNLYIHNETK